MTSGLVRNARRWSDAVLREPRGAAEARLVLGVLPGEGIGPEVISAALGVLAALESPGCPEFEICTGGAIGRDAEVLTGRALSDDVAAFCGDVFGRGGAVLAGPGEAVSSTSCAGDSISSASCRPFSRSSRFSAPAG